MIQEIFPHQYDNSFLHRRDPKPEDFVLSYTGEKALVRDGEKLSFPLVSEIIPHLSDPKRELIYLFTIDERAFFLWEHALEELHGFCWVPVASFRSLTPSWLAFAGITGSQLYRWQQANRFCGHCGTPTKPSEIERAFCCEKCGAIVYPRLSPAVIVAVTNKDKILVSRYANRPTNSRYALIAGFTEIGETVEETVHREVMEEVGLRVKNLRYYASQPWSFSDTLLFGFFAELDGEDTITLEEEELAEACWLSRDELPEPGNLISMTATMIEAFRQSKEKELHTEKRIR